MKIGKFIKTGFTSFILASSSVGIGAQEIGSVNTEWKLGGSHKIVVEALKDEKVQGVTCHISYAKTGKPL